MAGLLALILLSSFEHSYPVPQEVGKVGNESASFIHPVSERKDGLESLFRKQKEQNTSSSKVHSGVSRGKRKAEDIGDEPEGVSAKGEGKEVVLKAEDDEVIVLDGPSDSVSRGLSVL